MAEIIRSEHSGFCFGVKRAMEKTQSKVFEQKSAGKERSSKRIYTFGPLIHNKIVIDDLAEQGVEIIDSLRDTKPGDTVIVRSHGESAEFYQLAKAAEVEIVDATCPFVERIHKLAADAGRQGKQVVIVGNKNHPEVIGINGWCSNTAIIINSQEEAEKIQGSNFFVLCQTTLRKETLDEILSVFDKNEVGYEVVNTICNATKERQDSCMELSRQVEAMVVIGDKESSNSKKLFEIAKKYCKNAYFIENISDLPLHEVQKYYKIGVAAGASTPEPVIKEVIANMSERALEANEKNLMEDFMDEIDASLKLPRAGEIVEGKIHMITDNEVIVNLGCKKDGILPKTEISLKEGDSLKDLFKEDDVITAKVIKTGDDDGGILLSMKSLEVLKHWDELAAASENHESVNVKVVRAINSGAIASYKDVDGFIPMSQLANKYVENAQEFIGQEFEVKVIRADKKKQRVIFSRKSVLREERKKLVEERWSSLQVGDVVAGKVMRFAEFGAFIDLGGIDGLLHISEISWGKLRHPSEVLTLGEIVNVKILSMNEETGKISLGLKQITPEPWSIIDEKFVVGDVVTGKVVQLKEYGAFVELEPGLDGLVHISEIVDRRIEEPSEVLKIGQVVNAKIIGVDKERKRISLSLKENSEEVAEATEVSEEPVAVEEPAVEEAAEEVAAIEEA